MPRRVAEGDRRLQPRPPERLVDGAVVARHHPQHDLRLIGEERAAERALMRAQHAHDVAGGGIGVRRRRSGRSTDARAAHAPRRGERSRRRPSVTLSLPHDPLVYNSPHDRRARRRPRRLRVEGSAQADARRARRRLARLRHHLHQRRSTIPTTPRRWRRRWPAATADRGILVCGSGVGMAIAANKVPGIRAAPIADAAGAALAREHNDVNVLTLAGAPAHADAAPGRSSTPSCRRRSPVAATNRGSPRSSSSNTTSRPRSRA